MSKYSKITQINASASLYAESVPHFFHWDLTYLWMLEKVSAGEKAHIPQEWQDYLDGWDHLLSLFLTGKLGIEEQPLKSPFAKYAEPFGVTSVQWVVPNGETTPIGVVSPTVIVRPLPDFETGHRVQWPMSEVDSPDFAHFVTLLHQSLEAENHPFPNRLAAVLESRFDATGSTAPANEEKRGVQVSLPMLDRVRWGSAKQNPLGLSIDVIVQAPSDGERQFIPQCPTEGGVLLQQPTDEPIQVGATNTEISVPCPHCGQSHSVSLRDLLIWSRNDAEPEVVLWNRLSGAATEAPEKGWPPTPKVQGTTVTFEWSVAQFPSHRNYRLLKLNFRDLESQADIHTLKIEDVLYEKLLVPGQRSADAFTGLPVRLEWFDALQNDAVPVQFSRSNDVVTFKDVQFRGWPGTIDLRFDRAQVEPVPDVTVGRYPDPKYVPESWQQFRYFAAGQKRQEFRVRGRSADGKKTPDELLPWVIESGNGFLRAFEVTKGRAGVTYRADRPHQSSVDRSSTQPLTAIPVGVDFGTTNTIVYAKTRELQTQSVKVSADNGVKPSDILQCVDWLAPAIQSQDQQVVEQAQRVDFLPIPSSQTSVRDEYLAPSEVWDLPTREQILIRWGGSKPTEDAQVHTKFKFDADTVDPRRSFRVRYLVELMYLYLPAIFASVYEGKPRANITNVEFGFAFPLAMAFDQRQHYRKALEAMTQELSRATGIDFHYYSISESQACINALGQYQPGETFIIADMGGGTMDVSLMEITGANHKPVIHQIGSLRYAGEDFLEILNQREGRHDLMSIRDGVRSGKQMALDAAAAPVLTRFIVLALEFLRVMGEAHMRNEARDAFPKVLLVGNGWHLIEVFNDQARRKGPSSYFKEHYAKLLETIHPDGELEQERVVGEMPTSKHLVVNGALQNLFLQPRREELSNAEGGAMLSRLPAGRTTHITSRNGDSTQIEWNELVGEGEPIPSGLDASVIRSARVNFDLKGSPILEASTAWRQKLVDALRSEDVDSLPYPSPEVLVRTLFNHLSETHITRGPLQIILEDHWLEDLQKRQ